MNLDWSDQNPKLYLFKASMFGSVSSQALNNFCCFILLVRICVFATPEVEELKQNLKQRIELKLELSVVRNAIKEGDEREIVYKKIENNTSSCIHKPW